MARNGSSIEPAWSDLDIARLIALYPYNHTRDIVHLFPGRTAKGLTRKAARKGLYKTNEARAAAAREVRVAAVARKRAMGLSPNARG